MQKRQILSEYELELKKYYFKCFTSEASKTAILFIISIPVGVIKEFSAALILLILLRSNGGGLHLKHYFSCLLTSFLFLYGSIFLALYIQPAKIVICACMILFAIMAYDLVPVTSPNRPAATALQIKRSRRNTFIIISFIFVLICICPVSNYSYICFWTVLLHIFQLLAAHLRR